MKKLLLEIHTEEIPAGYIEPALEALAAGLLKSLDNARIEHGGAETMGTPRRLAVVVDAAVQQRPMTAEVIGPPQKAGFDENGAPTVAAEKFAQKMGIPIKEIRIKETPKGRYLCAVKTEKGLPSQVLLKTILPQAISSIPFPKTMRWADLQTPFARPIRSILSLFGSSVISFGLEKLKSGRRTSGHRFLNPGNIRISDASEYVDTLRSASVLVDIRERKKKAAEEVSSAAARLGGKILEDPELLDLVKNLVEYPIAVAGRFDRKFLELPREILITAMREHQKYFAVVDRSDELMPYFVALNNTPVKEAALAAKGHERVLRARLEDAAFFYRADLKTPLEQFVDRLGGVLFQAKLGSMRDKVQRVERLAGFLADSLLLGGEAKRDALRAARLSKADLVSQVVGEFPKLQGVMGRIYAAAAGEPEPVSAAVEEHYRPTYSGGPLPETLAGSVLAIADKSDSVCGCFSIGLVPTGASDPYALRRQGIGLIQIALKNRFSFSLRGLIEESLKPFDAGTPTDAAEEVYLFLRSRMSQMLVDDGFPKDVVSAVVSVSADDIPDVWRRAGALAALKSAPDFEPLAIAFKRVVNIIRQAEQKGEKAAEGGEVKPELFEASCEFELNAACDAVSRMVARDLGEGHYDRAFQHMATLRKTVDAFFDGVMVLTEDRSLKSNRLSLLNRIAGLFEGIADFSKIST